MVSLIWPIFGLDFRFLHLKLWFWGFADLCSLQSSLWFSVFVKNDGSFSSFSVQCILQFLQFFQQDDPVQTWWFCYAQQNSRIKFCTTLAWQQFKRPTFLLPASKLPSVQLGVAKSSTYLFLKQPQDKEHFITELLDFETI